MFRRIATLALLLPWFLGATQPAQSHPHAWIDMRTWLVFDPESKVAALKVHWIFDEFYTLFTLEVIDPDGDGKADPQKIRDLARENLKNLADYSYFTFFKVDGAQPAYATVEEYDSYLNGDRLIMEFTVPLEQAVDPMTHSLSYAVYDPTYYIELFHVDTGSVAMDGPAPAGCTLRLEEPNPDPDMVTLAASLDQDESAGDGLGAFFAEQVYLNCP